MLRRCATEAIPQARVHVLLDGRDVGETTALEYLEPLEALLAELSHNGRDYRIASGGGRMRVTMDRYEADWQMVERGWRLHVQGVGRTFSSASEAVRTFRDEEPGIGDQFLPGFVVAGADGEAVGPIRDGSSVVFFNFRGDRAIEISRALRRRNVPSLPIEAPRPDIAYAGMMQYDGDLQLPQPFPVSSARDRPDHGGVSSAQSNHPACLQRNQKYGHVTYFWNGNRSGCFDEAARAMSKSRATSFPSSKDLG